MILITDDEVPNNTLNNFSSASFATAGERPEIVINYTLFDPDEEAIHNRIM